jgi:membrane protein required for colicin V production
VNWIDVIVLAVLALFALRGYVRGAFRELFSLAGLVGGFLAAVGYHGPVAEQAAAYWQLSPLILKGTAFVAIFFVVYFAFNLVGWLLHRSAKVLYLHTLNRVGGAAVGIGKGAALAALILFFVSSASWVPLSTRHKLDAAYLASPLAQLAEALIRVGKETLVPKERDQTRASAGHQSV